MSKMFKTPKPKPVQQTVEPVVIDESEQTKQLEEARKKRRGAAMSFISGNTSLSGNQVRKTTLGE